MWPPCRKEYVGVADVVNLLLIMPNMIPHTFKANKKNGTFVREFWEN